MDPQKSDRPSGPARVDAVMVTSQTSSAAVPQVNEGRKDSGSALPGAHVWKPTTTGEETGRRAVCTRGQTTLGAMMIGKTIGLTRTARNGWKMVGMLLLFRSSRDARRNRRWFPEHSLQSVFAPEFAVDDSEKARLWDIQYLELPSAWEEHCGRALHGQ